MPDKLAIVYGVSKADLSGVRTKGSDEGLTFEASS